MNEYEDITLFDEAEETTEIIDTTVDSPIVKEIKLDQKIAGQDLFPANAFFQPYELFWKKYLAFLLSQSAYVSPF